MASHVQKDLELIFQGSVVLISLKVTFDFITSGIVMPSNFC
jgi:hypothetical protein